MIRSLASLALAAALSSAASSQSLMTKPDVYGDMIVFTAEGDLWLGSIKDGNAKRITSHEGVETWAKFSPDGKTIAFSAAYDQGRDVYVMPVEGGVPKRLTYDPTLAEVQGWSPDGKYVIYRSYRESPPSNDRRLWRIPAEGGQSEMLPIPRAEHGDMAPDGKTVAFVPVSAEWMNWFHYRGGAADDVWITDTSQKTFTRLTNDKAVDTTPVWVGNNLYFASQRDGYSNLYSLDPKSKRTKKVTTFSEPVRYPKSDGKTVVFQVGYGLGMYDPQTNSSKLLNLQLGSDRIHVREKRFNVANSITSAGIGPTGKRVVVAARGQIFTFPAEEGASVLIENKPGTRAEGPAWSPDGKKIAFVSDRSGERQIWVSDANGQGEPTQITKDLKGVMTTVGWSPDGKWLTTTTIQGDIFLIDAQTGAARSIAKNEYVSSYNSVTALPDFSQDSRLMAYTVIDKAFLNAVYVYDIEAGKSYRVSSPMMNCASPAFDPKGRYLAFTATRDFNGSYNAYTSEIGYTRPEKLNVITLQADAPSPFLIKESEEGTPAPAPPKEEKKDEKPTPIVYDIAGAASRLIDIPVPGGNYGNLAWAGSRILFTSLEDGQPGAKLMAYDVEKKGLSTISERVEGLELSADGKKLLIYRGNNLHIAPADAAQISPESGRVNIGDTKLTVDPMSEWKQVFNESWRIYRDFFYDAGMHGLDWDAIRRKYEPLMERVGDRTDVNRVVADMVAELNTGHIYVVDPSPSPQRINVGYLGANLTPVQGRNAVKIEKILRGDEFELDTASPLAAPGLGIKEGEYILAVNGAPVRADEDIQAMLIGLANQVISLEVNSSPNREGSRQVRVKPISSESRLRYLDWARTRREYVREKTSDTIGYVHVPNMGNAGLYEFVKGYYSSLEKDGIIYDIRENTGGWISSLLLKSIGTKNLVWWAPRSGKDWSRESGWAPMGYGVALASEGNFSDGELFLETWRRMGLGPIIGVRTSGAEVGSGGGWALIDGGTIYPPNYGTYADGKWVIEGEGVNPDIWVDQDMAAVLAGRDPQLEKAIEVLKEKIRKNPIKRPVAPPGPKRTGPGE